MIVITGIHKSKIFNFISSTDDRLEAYIELLAKWIGSTISIDKNEDVFKAVLVDSQNRFWFCEDFYCDEPFFVTDER